MEYPECLLCVGSCWLEEQEQTCPCADDFPRNATCPGCGGAGTKDGAECRWCDGLKMVCDREKLRSQLVELNGLNAEDFEDCPMGVAYS